MAGKYSNGFLFCQGSGAAGGLQRWQKKTCQNSYDGYYDKKFY